MTYLEKALFTALNEIVYHDRSVITADLTNKAKLALKEYRRQLEQELRDRNPIY